MEGLIPFLVLAIKKTQNLHKHGYSRSISDGSKRSYHLLGSTNESINGGSSHRRTRSEFQAPASMDLQPEVVEFIRSRSFKSNTTITTNNNDYNSRTGFVGSTAGTSCGLRQMHHGAHAAGSKPINMVYQY